MHSEYMIRGCEALFHWLQKNWKIITVTVSAANPMIALSPKPAKSKHLKISRIQEKRKNAQEEKEVDVLPYFTV